MNECEIYTSSKLLEIALSLPASQHALYQALIAEKDCRIFVQHKQVQQVNTLEVGMQNHQAEKMPAKTYRMYDAIFEQSADWQCRLKLAGLPVIRRNEPGYQARRAGSKYIQRYLVQIIHLQASYVAALGLGGAETPLTSEGSSILINRYRRLEQLAVRALYTVNLSIGEVRIAADPEYGFLIESIGPVDLSLDSKAKEAARLLLRMLQELNAYTAREARSKTLLIGMDPEFILLNPNTRKVVPATRFLSYAGEVGCDFLRYRGERRFPFVELRPSPGSSPREVIGYLLRAFQQAYQAIEDRSLIWQAGGMPQKGFPLGGHVHFSGLPVTYELLRTLDNYVALPVATLEDSRSFRRRPRYGWTGDFRLQPHGGFEYRTLPSFLISPLVTKGVVALCILIADQHDCFNKRPLDQFEVFKAFYTGEQLRLRKELDGLFADVSAHPRFSDYASYLSPFMEAALSGKSWDEARDIRRAWNLQNDS